MLTCHRLHLMCSGDKCVKNDNNVHFLGVKWEMVGTEYIGSREKYMIEINLKRLELLGN